MSRIAGIVGARGEAPADLSLRGMLGASLTPGPEGEVHAARTDGVTLGWAGRGDPGLVATPDALCALDGSVYNAAELGRASSDAALVAGLVREHGFLHALRRLNGDFAISYFDRRTRELWLARDRFGVRPLYHLREPEGFAFASRPRSLLRLPGVSKAADGTAGS